MLTEQTSHDPFGKEIAACAEGVAKKSEGKKHASAIKALLLSGFSFIATLSIIYRATVKNQFHCQVALFLNAIPCSSSGKVKTSLDRAPGVTLTGRDALTSGEWST